MGKAVIDEQHTSTLAIEYSQRNFGEQHTFTS